MPNLKVLRASHETAVLTKTTLGKPADDHDAVSMLKLLSGTTHQVSTGVCVMVMSDTAPDEPKVQQRCFVETTDVAFFELADDEIASYVASGEPYDKAGAYGAQAMGRLLVREIRGDYFNVVGLPVARVVRVLADMGFVNGMSEGDRLLSQLLSRRGD